MNKHEHSALMNREAEATAAVRRMRIAQYERYTRWEKAPAQSLLQQSPESSRGQARWWLHHLADRLEYAAADLLTVAEAQRRDAWLKLLEGPEVRAFLVAISEFSSVSDTELTSYGLVPGWTAGEYRALIVDAGHSVVEACMRGSLNGIRSRVLDMQMMLDGDYRVS
ncbi:hypothetical protein FEK35_23990 [Nocardia cyriacigeorgica]|uniref:Uncharacterized protein n=1 Tax=Nocardia cyriacigeorgica TaxID=135487 RepID=A0A5R8P8W6_9NOCA|nr:hypothetical protein [Nocardia cyriacigeorgica]TLG00309.1 hypothetical protein FEK35_23990 [Nocardia cyriacigeorgica]